MVGLKEKEKDFVSKSQEQLRQSRIEDEKKRYIVMDKCASSNPIRYKSSNDPQRFVKYLKSRIDKWEYLSSKGSFYGKNMLKKTNQIIQNLET